MFPEILRIVRTARFREITNVSSSFPGPLIGHGLPVSGLNGTLKQQWSHIGVFICYQNIDVKKN